VRRVLLTGAAGRIATAAGDVDPDDGIPFQGGPSTARESGGWAV
jgi:hypothetical protein